MRQLDPDTLQAARDALEDQNKGSARETQALHLAEKWRVDLLADDAAIAPPVALRQACRRPSRRTTARSHWCAILGDCIRTSASATNATDQSH